LRLLYLFLVLFQASLKSQVNLLIDTSSQRKLSQVENLVFEGAGIKGVAYSGVIKELERTGIISNVKRVCGTSAGAITSLMVSIGYSSSEIYQIISETKFQKFNYGQFSDTTIQSGSSATAYAMKLNTVDLASGFNIVGGTRITAANSGTFNLQFSAQLFQTTNNAAEISIWLRKDGINVPNSNTDLTIEKISGGGKLVAAWNYIVQLNATQYVELMWSSTRNDTQIFSSGTQSSPSRPATPSVIVSMTQIA
jgi:hypothetical protein